MEERMEKRLMKSYKKYASDKIPSSHIVTNCIKAFFVGGLICIIGQFFINTVISMGVSKDMSSYYVAVIMVFLGSFLTGIGVYDDIGKFAGAGSILPITGFANSIVSPAIEFKSEGFILGVGAKMFLIAGPVLVYGISTSIISGVIYFIIKLI